MLIVERQARLLEMVRQRRAAQLDELSRSLGVSQSTVRRDLDQLESRGLVERTHGGVIYRGDPSEAGQAQASTSLASPPLASALTGTLAGSLAGQGTGKALATRMEEHIAEKQAIGRIAAALVQPQMTVLMDGGSTVIFAARQVTARPIQVVTNSLAIANLYHDDEQVELLLIGGNLYPRTGVTLGPIATGTLAELHADLLLFSAAGIYDDAAFNLNLTLAQTEQAMMRQAARTVMLMDSGKFGRKSLSRVCDLDEVDLIVSDERIDPAWRERLGDRLAVAPG